MKKKTVALTSALFLLLSIACGVPQEQFDALATDLEGRKADLIGMQDSVTGMQARISELQDASTVTAKVVLALGRDITELQGELEDSKSLLSGTELTLTEKSDQLAESEESITTLSDNLEARDEEIKGLSQEVEGLIQKFAVSEANVADLKQSLASRDAELEDSQQEASNLDTELSRANKAKTVLDSLVADLQAQVSLNSEAEVQAEINALIVKRDALVTKVKQLATLTEGYLLRPDVEINTFALGCTGSMLPVLHCGDIVIMQTNLKHRDIQKGDIISFQRQDCLTDRTMTGSTILHRVVDIGNDWFVTQGDNNYTVDSCRVPISNVKGKLLAFIEDIYPEDYVVTANYEAIKTKYNDRKERFDRDRANYQEQLELLEDAEDDYYDGTIRFSSYKNILEDTKGDLLSLKRLNVELDGLADTVFALQDMIIGGTYNDADWTHLVN